jgi:hypothetical protein
MRLALVLAVATLASLYACSSSRAGAPPCTKPATTTYDCTYASPEAGACEGTDALAPQPVGCVATLPECSPEAPQIAQMCLCTVVVDAAQWKCPY